MRYGSVCSGVEAASMAWEPLGWEPVFFSEIEAFPSAVLQHHWPNVPNHGDMTKFEEWGYERGSIDVLVGGTPCQSFSIAGLRGGLGDDRGNLALVFMRMVDRLRPKYVIWENVPGVLSSNGGKDFGSILSAMDELRYGWAYRILDAQYFGVPQRRRRLFLVGHSSGDARRAAEILFESEGGSRDIETCEQTRKETSRDVRKGTLFDRQRTDQYGGGGLASTLAARDYKSATDLIVETFAGNKRADIAATLQTTCGDYSRADGFNTITYEEAVRNAPERQSGKVTHQGLSDGN